MPLVTKTASRCKSRRPRLLAYLAVTVLPLVVVFAWSWFQPIEILHPKGVVRVGYYPGIRRGGWLVRSNSGWGWMGVKWSGWVKPGAYIIAWGWSG